jgi:hypothetical protein
VEASYSPILTDKASKIELCLQGHKVSRNNSKDSNISSEANDVSTSQPKRVSVTSKWKSIDENKLNSQNYFQHKNTHSKIDKNATEIKIGMLKY